MLVRELIKDLKKLHQGDQVLLHEEGNECNLPIKYIGEMLTITNRYVLLVGKMKERRTK